MLINILIIGVLLMCRLHLHLYFCMNFNVCVSTEHIPNGNFFVRFFRCVNKHRIAVRIRLWHRWGLRASFADGNSKINQRMNETYSCTYWVNGRICCLILFTHVSESTVSSSYSINCTFICSDHFCLHIFFQKSFYVGIALRLTQAIYFGSTIYTPIYWE